jgi:glycosyltransferase involved in cell wall biosynthesis
VKPPKLSDLPENYLQKQGFPWTEGSPEHTNLQFENKKLPKISIITPSYNQAMFLEETVRSVLLQDYPDLEYIIIDGGSTDDSIGIIKKYQPWLTHWVSEPDSGQSDAINKGMRHACGDILAYINSDDMFIPGALLKVAKTFIELSNIDIVYGITRPIDNRSKLLPVHEQHKNVLKKGFQKTRLLKFGNYIPQTATFWKCSVLDGVGEFDESLHLIMDYDYWIRAVLLGKQFYHLPAPLAYFRYHSTAKTSSASSKKKDAELRYVCKKNNLPYFTHKSYEWLNSNLLGRWAAWNAAWKEDGVNGMVRKIKMALKNRANRKL